MNTAVAVLCGWRDIKHCEHFSYGDKPVTDGYEVAHKLPDYATDLNEIAVAESELLHDYPLKSRYITALSIVMINAGTNNGETVFATPDQRTEALLRTFGKWSPANVQDQRRREQQETQNAKET
jgi:hypothetical protein